MFDLLRQGAAFAVTLAPGDRRGPKVSDTSGDIGINVRPGRSALRKCSSRPPTIANPPLRKIFEGRNTSAEAVVYWSMALPMTPRLA
ncbi:hypothetical protein [Streptomyces sp. NPDC058755]|uniref:hypothetical protein n=1 Tax=Streptomyces sp. NPDC058755 TaxID=3346624 RepID=UPI0036A48B37